MDYRRQAERLLEHADPAEKKRFLRIWVDETKPAPEERAVETACRLPEPDECIGSGGRI